MKLRLEPPDSYHLSAAIGWLELGNSSESLLELDQVSELWRDHPDLLEIRWSVLARMENWEKALETARSLLEKDPGRASAWLHRAYALRRTKGGGIKAAWDALLPASAKFPNEPVIPYNLSCYACQMRNLDEARVWLDRAVKAGGLAEIKAMAMADDDLEPLREEIRKL